MSFYKINSSQVDWQTEESYVFFNEKMAAARRELFTSYLPLLPRLKSHIWLSTSGRTQEKWVALSKKAILLGAQSVNKHLEASTQDRWGLALPLFHIGGLAILARAYLAKNPCFSYSKTWSPTAYISFLKEHQITLSSLVPTQVYDLVKLGQLAPDSLRAIVVGGAYLSRTLYLEARRLNWPLLVSYGLTECASQVATAELNSLKTTTSPPLMKILPHVQARIQEGELVIKSESLLTGLVPIRKDGKVRLQNPKKSEEYFTGDVCCTLDSNFLRIDPEKAQPIKIVGEKLNWTRLEEELLKILLKNPKVQAGNYLLLPVPMEREGHQVALVSDHLDLQVLTKILGDFNQRVAPFERIRQFYLVPSLPLSGISKILKKPLLKKLGF